MTVSEVLSVRWLMWLSVALIGVVVVLSLLGVV
jgi:hypothetical protein